MLDQERLARTFVRLCETDSPSLHEAGMAALLRGIFTELGADAIIEDESAARTGADCGNLIMRFDGDPGREALFINCHMDTVEPGIGVRVRRQDGVFSSAGDTVLGADDKAGIAALIEALQALRDQGLAICPLDCVFTTAEEIGLLGAKALDPGLIRARMGYALDTSGSGRVVVAAPACKRMVIRLRGVAAHAGLHPEWGVSALKLAARALAAAPDGRIDHETTVNFATIGGGTAINIVPELVTLEAEARSHSLEKLDAVVREIETIFRRTVGEWRDPSGQAQGRPAIEIEIEDAFPLMRLERTDPVLRRIESAAAGAGMELDFVAAGGGSDANVFNGRDLATAIVFTGMHRVHSTDEQVELADMVALTRLLMELFCAAHPAQAEERP